MGKLKQELMECIDTVNILNQEGIYINGERTYLKWCEITLDLIEVFGENQVEYMLKNIT